MKISYAFVVIALFATVKCGYLSETYGESFGGFRAIAQESANRAHSAVSSQNAAALQASYITKNALAQQATQSAATAETALKGKQIELHELEKQHNEEHKALVGELEQLQLAKQSAVATDKSALQASQQVKVARKALTNARNSAQQAAYSAAHAAQEQASQNAMVAKAKAKLQEIDYKLEEAYLDFSATRAVGQRVAAFAREAKSNAASVGSRANYDEGLDFFGLGAGHEIIVL